MCERISFNGTAGNGFTISLHGFAASVSEIFSFSAPELCIGDFFSVPARLQSEWLIVRERMDHFWVSITGLICAAVPETVRSALNFAYRAFNVRRLRILRLAFSGRRL